MDSPAPPMEIEREDLWLLGLVGVLLVGAGLSIAWTSVQTDVATFTVSDPENGGPLAVTIARWNGTDFATARESVVADGTETVFRTTDPGRYRATLATEDAACELRVSVTATDDGLRQHTLGNGPSCPGWLSVRITDTLTWQAPSRPTGRFS